MRVLVTGHDGYIGGVLTPMLLQRGHKVVGLDSGLFRACLYVGAVPEVPAIRKDIRDIDQTRFLSASFDPAESNLATIPDEEVIKIVSPLRPVIVHWVAGAESPWKAAM